MKKYDHLLYKRGFLLTDLKTLSINNSVTLEIMKNWNKVYIDKYQILMEPSLKYGVCRRKRETVVVLGLVLNPYNNEIDIQKIAESLCLKLKESKNLFLDELDELSGRFTIITFKDGNTEVYGDACGTRTIYYDTKSNNTLISSHSFLISEIMQYQTSEVAKGVLANKTFRGRKYLPGLLSPFDEIKPLTPNTSYNIEKRQVSRFFPREMNDKINFDESIEIITNVLKNQSTLLNKISKTLVSLTAGLDSRVTLAIQSSQNTESKYFTHYNSDNIEPYLEDMIIAEKLARSLKLDFSQYGYSTKEEQEDLQEFRYVWQRNIGMYRGSLKQFKMYTDNLDDNRIHIRSNVAEIARVYYKDREKDPTSDHLASLFSKSEYGKNEFVIKQFDDFIDTTSFFNENFYNYNYADLFYWEHRMGLWHSWLVLESDTAFETFVPFNNRKLLKTMLSVPEEYRGNDELMIAVLKKTNSKLLDYPVNKKIIK
ncbi:hypothetical protein BUY93_09485 [Mammaliicoccus fleurettii]|nr:hypothetical protein BUY93_09485 [Mammaliicoccus fleurettii]